ncbi:uridine kinase [Nocardioides sp. SR21]|uniref:uridine kinase family protein n=1 Tax=Nocardioides sp. SR21 TaxID=2919501 RepID=UPI001FAAFA5B|nr:4-amino-4-deoxy-L-arabinose transferase [Nocardioides sp. SR21]
MDRPSDAARVLDLTRSRPPTLGAGRLICVDGPAGSGKTTLAAGLGAPVIHMDELIEGWTGLRTVDAQLDGLLRPHTTGQPGSYRRYDWHAGAYAETVAVPPVPLLVLEGVGAGSLVVADLVTVLVWIEAPRDVRMARGIERDGDAFAPYWETWAAEEAEEFVRNRTRERADLRFRT